ncbi:hypothetical protein LOC67_23015 [Stieleria sp. JC731]|uniref:hypothetical protein n=1 Tax=Pirellulaceae TaxID=2691357 RepID=UPI001E34DF56|nr:hypothetical protein [Stieleria sp. JC731]MCC9603430.1 hypothetical protein [Stieleria sp. JC731]
MSDASTSEFVLPAPATASTPSIDVQQSMTMPAETSSIPTWAQSPSPSIVGGSNRPKLVFQPAVPTHGANGLPMLHPEVHIADALEPIAVPSITGELEAQQYKDGVAGLNLAEERVQLPSQAQADSRWVPGTVKSRLADRFQTRRTPIRNVLDKFHTMMAVARCRDLGVGVERLPFALSEIDAARPSNNIRVRLEAGYNWEYPDRAEFFWSRMGGAKGPSLTVPVEDSVDYQDLRVAIEVGGAKFSATTELPLRFIDPTVLGNTGSLGDMVLTTKTVMMDGDSLLLTQVLRTQMATGTAKAGRGNGHVSMEPGFVAGYRYSDRTMLHSELKLWFPIGGEPDFSGPVLRYGFGVANVLYDSDTFAIIPTFEMVAWSVLNAQKTGSLGQAITVDGEDIINVFPGIRVVKDSGGEFGLFELGVSGGTTVTTSHWYESMIRMDFRWTF